MEPSEGEITRLLGQLNEDGEQALVDLIPLLYRELHALAYKQMAGERKDHTFQPTALLHEAFLRLVQRKDANWQNRHHFIRVSACVMRTILVNHARDARRSKRGGDRKKLPIDEALAVVEKRAIDLVALDEALSKLKAIEPRQHSVVELRFFGGLTVDDTADVLGVSPRTVEEDWSIARAWLLRQVRKE